MRRTLRIATVVAALATVPARAADPPAPMSLRDAVSKKLVVASARGTGTWREVDLVLENVTDAPLALDLAATLIEPTQKLACVRLGLGPARTDADAALSPVEVGAKQTWTQRVPSCAVDSGLPLPTKDCALRLSADAPQPTCGKVLRWWSAHPTAALDDVAEALWRRDEHVRFDDPTVPRRPEKRDEFAPKPDVPAWREVAQRAGTLFRVERGELTSVDAAGIVRYHATGVCDVYPDEDGLFVLKAPPDEGIWRLPGVDGGEATCVKSRDEQGFWISREYVRGVATAGAAGVFVVYGRFSQCFRAGAVQNEYPVARDNRSSSGSWSEYSIRHDGDGRLLLVSTSSESVGGRDNVQVELWSFDVAPGKSKRVAKYTKVGDVKAGPAGVFAVSDKGALQRANRGDWKLIDVNVTGKWTSILAVATDVLWAFRAGGELHCVDAKTGKIRSSGPVGWDAPWRVDEVSGDLVRPTDDGYERMRTSDAKRETLPAAPR